MKIESILTTKVQVVLLNALNKQKEDEVLISSEVGKIIGRDDSASRRMAKKVLRSETHPLHHYVLKYDGKFYWGTPKALKNMRRSLGITT